MLSRRSWAVKFLTLPVVLCAACFLLPLGGLPVACASAKTTKTDAGVTTDVTPYWALVSTLPKYLGKRTDVAALGNRALLACGYEAVGANDHRLTCGIFERGRKTWRWRPTGVPPGAAGALGQGAWLSFLISDAGEIRATVRASTDSSGHVTYWKFNYTPGGSDHWEPAPPPKPDKADLRWDHANLGAVTDDQGWRFVEGLGEVALLGRGIVARRTDEDPRVACGAIRSFWAQQPEASGHQWNGVLRRLPYAQCAGDKRLLDVIQQAALGQPGLTQAGADARVAAYVAGCQLGARWAPGGWLMRCKKHRLRGLGFTKHVWGLNRASGGLCVPGPGTR